MSFSVTYIPNPSIGYQWAGSVEGYAMIESVAGRIRDVASELAPVDTGTLASSIEYDIDQRGQYLEATIGSDVRYAGFVEFGTSIPTPAQPYLRPALDYVMESI